MVDYLRRDDRRSRRRFLGPTGAKPYSYGNWLLQFTIGATLLEKPYHQAHRWFRGTSVLHSQRMLDPCKSFLCTVALTSGMIDQQNSEINSSGRLLPPLSKTSLDWQVSIIRLQNLTNLDNGGEYGSWRGNWQIEYLMPYLQNALVDNLSVHWQNKSIHPHLYS